MLVNFREWCSFSRELSSLLTFKSYHFALEKLYVEPLHLQRVITLLLLLIFWGKITRSYKLHISVFITIIVYKKNNAFVSFNCYVRYWFDSSGSSSNEVMTVFIVNTFQVFEVGFLFRIHNFNENSFLQYTIVLQGWQFSKRNINTIWFALNFGNALQGKMLKKTGFFLYTVLNRITLHCSWSHGW